MQILQKDIPVNRKLLYSLNSIYGIGKNEANFILEKLKIGKRETPNTLSKDKLQELKDFLESKSDKYGIQKRRNILSHIEKQVSLKTYRGFRHKHKYPVRGQRTRSNHKTAKRRTF